MQGQERLLEPIVLLKEELQSLQIGAEPLYKQERHPRGQGWQIDEESS